MTKKIHKCIVLFINLVKYFFFIVYLGTNDPDVIGPEGMEKFCEDIGVEPENVCNLSFLIICLPIFEILLN